MEQETTVLQKIIKSIHHVQSERLTLRLILNGMKQQPIQWVLDFYEGNLVWCNREYHRHRRFVRALQQHAPTILEQHWTPKIYPLIQKGLLHREHWEFHLLDLFRREGVIKIHQIELIQQTYLLETLITLSEGTQVNQQLVQTANIPETIVSPSVLAGMGEAQQWQKQHRMLCDKYSESLMQGFSFDAAPVIQQVADLKAKVNPLVFNQLEKILTGENTFWDIAGQLEQTCVSIACVLLPLLESGGIRLQDTGDIDFKEYRKPKPVAKIKTAPKQLIACIDDSPLIAKEIERILKPHGYEILSVTDPLKGLATLIKAKPSLIFLDLVMPNTNGYEICTVLRKSSQFTEVPIVMLTGHDGIVDRLRAKLVGSTDFLGKPPDPIKVHQVVEKYLKPSKTAMSSSHGTLSNAPV